MDNIIIEGSDKSPVVEFKTDGYMKLEGTGRIENTLEFFDPLFKWTESVTAEEMTFEVNLEYYNTAFSKCLLEIFKLLKKNKEVKSTIVNWHYDEEDEDSLESAEMLRDLFSGFKFNFIINPE